MSIVKVKIGGRFNNCYDCRFQSFGGVYAPECGDSPPPLVCRLFMQSLDRDYKDNAQRCIGCIRAEEEGEN